MSIGKFSFSSFSKPTSQENGLDHIFPESAERKKMTLVFTCLSCLICLMMIAISAGLRAGSHWGSAFERNYVLELRSIPEISSTEQMQTAMTILKNDRNVSEIDPVTGDELKKLMAPWLGEGLDLNELPLSQLVKIEIASDDIKGSLEKLKQDLIQIPGAGIEAYHEAKAEYKAAGHAVRLISTISAIILIIVVAGVTAASVESGVLDNKKIVSIMRLIGTENALIVKLFVQKVLSHAVKGALAGMIVALGVIAFISLVGIIDGLGGTFIFSQFLPGIDIIFFLACVPLTIVGVGYISGKRTINKMLKNFI